MRSVRIVLFAALGVVSCRRHEDPVAAPASDSGTPDDDAYVPKPPAVPVTPTLIGTGGFAYRFGSTFAGATAPSSMVKVGPDTKGPWGTINFLHYNGYWYSDDVIQGFSHMHMSGTGATDYGVLAIMPLEATATAAAITPNGYGSKFKKPSEHASPGYYAVILDRGNVKVEITATPHAAHHRFAYPSGGAHVLVDLDHHLNGGTVKDAEVTLGKDGTFKGRLRSMGQMSNGFGGFDLFFVGKSKAPWSKSQVWSVGAPPAEGSSASGTAVGFALDFDAPDPELQIGLSLTSMDAAAANLTAEMPSFDFDGEKKTTSDAWQAIFDRVKVDAAHRDLFQSALYHSFLMPTVLEDVDRTYTFGGKTQKSDDFHFVNDLSLWDTYRTVTPLYALIAPDRDRDVVRSLHEMAKINGAFPRWPLATGEAGTMIGASAELVLADAYQKGITDWDASGAYAMLRSAALDATSANRGGRGDMELYMKYGYVPAGKGGAVSRSLEHAKDDAALANFAAALGKSDDAAALRARALNWRKLYDPATQTLGSKKEDGSWNDAHDDETLFSKDYVEADAAQTLWTAPHDIDGYVKLFGGRAAAVAKLDDFFAKGKKEWDELDITDTLRSAGPRPYYWAGNEPDIHAGYMFSLLGRPDLAAKWLRWATDTFYGPGADGIPGNDDGGTMSAWYLFTSIGFYPLEGTDRYVVGTPMVTHAEIAVKGGTFIVDAPGASATSLYVQAVTLNGAPLSTPVFSHRDLRAGGKLAFVMGPSPSGWARVE